MEKKIIAELDWGQCPRCKQSKLVYFMNTYQAGVPGDGGTYITYILTEDNTITAICPKCKFQTNLIHTINGICSEEHAKENHYISNYNQSFYNTNNQYISEKEITIPKEVDSNDENIN